MLKVIKFGGTSVASSIGLQQILSVVQENLINNNQLVVICSALSGITDLLNEIANSVLSGDDIAHKLGLLYSNHYQLIKCLDISELTKLNRQLDRLFFELTQVLDNHDRYTRVTDFKNEVISFGEQLSCTIISHYLSVNKVKSKYVDARKIIKVTFNSHGYDEINFNLTNKNLEQFASGYLGGLVPVVTGFIARNTNGKTTNLGRGGSDYTAAIIASGVKANLIEIWTDSDGIMTADPKIITNPITNTQLGYDEVIELCSLGAKVVYTPTLTLAKKCLLPILVKNTFNPSNVGTLISHASRENLLASPAKSITLLDKLSLVTISHSGDLFSPEVLQQIAVCNQVKVYNILPISTKKTQIVINSSEYSRLRSALKSDLPKTSLTFKVKNNCAFISLIGNNINTVANLVDKFSKIVNDSVAVICSIDNNSSHSYSLLVSANSLSALITNLHSQIFSKPKYINLFVVGTGLIASNLLKQIADNYQFLLSNKNLLLRVVGIINTKKMLIDNNGIDLSNYSKQLSLSASANLDYFATHVIESKLVNKILIDCTSSFAVTQIYSSLLQNNISITTPNKIANSDSYANYLKLRSLAKDYHSKFLYETNVGAALPIISTLQDLINSGDRIIRIEGVLSGTLSYIFNNFKGEKSFSQVVLEAYENGYTEPDPRLDLSGIDVARKLLILVREAGFRLELSEIELENILPKSCLIDGSINSFFDLLQEHDRVFEELKQQADADNKVLRYIASYEDGNASVKLKMVDNLHPFYHLAGNTNIVAFTTMRYNEYPLVIQGPGAGGLITASGILSETIKLAQTD